MGWAECIELADYPNVILPAKIDTGAATSSLAVSDWEVKETNGEKFVEFTPAFLPLVKSRLQLVKMTSVRSSNGEVQDRPVVEMLVKIGGKKQKNLFTLADRSRMRYPALMGRSSLSRWQVDPLRTFRRSKKSDCAGKPALEVNK